MFETIHQQLRHIRANQVLILRMLSRVLKTEASFAMTLQDILDKQTASLQKANDALTLTAAIKVIDEKNTATIADLKVQLQAAIDAGGSPAQIQQIADNMDAIIAAQDSNAAAEAALAGTPPGTGDL